MLNLDGVRVLGTFVILAFLCFLAQRGLWFVRSILLPPSVVKSWDVAAVLGYNLVLCIGILTVVLFLVPAAFGLLTLGSLLVILVVLSRVYGARRATNASPGPRQNLIDVLRSLRARRLPLVLTLVSFGYFGWTLTYIRWPPPGDIMSLHGPLTLYLSTGSYTDVVSRLGYFYPFGFHLFPATLVGPLALYPAEAVFVFGGFIAALIAPMMYHVSERLGAPPLLAILAFTAAFVVHPSDNMEKWILGPFFNGPYPNLLGYLVVLLVAVLLIDHFRDAFSKQALMAYARPAVVYSLILAFVYPSFSALVFLHLALLFLGYLISRGRSGHEDQPDRQARKRLFLLLGVSVLAAGTVAAVLFTPLGGYVDQLYSSSPTGDVLAYQIDTGFFVDNITGVLIPVAFVISVRDVLVRRRIGLATFYLMIAILLALTLNPAIYRILWPILPSRSLLILGILAWPLVLVEIDSVIKRLRSSGQRVRSASTLSTGSQRARVAAPVAVILVVVLAAQALTFPAVNAFDAPVHYGWFSHTPYFADDFGGVEWLVAHARPIDLILSDGSYISRYALSIGFLSLSNGPPLEYNHTLFDALNLVWTDPANITYVAHVLKANNVQYIFSTSEWGTLDREYTVRYLPKPFSPDVYAQAFDTYPFLRIAYESGNTRVYGVVQSAL